MGQASTDVVDASDVVEAVDVVDTPDWVRDCLSSSESGSPLPPVPPPLPPVPLPAVPPVPVLPPPVPPPLPPEPPPTSPPPTPAVVVGVAAGKVESEEVEMSTGSAVPERLGVVSVTAFEVEVAGRIGWRVVEGKELSTPDGLDVSEGAFWSADGTETSDSVI